MLVFWENTIRSKAQIYDIGRKSVNLVDIKPSESQIKRRLLVGYAFLPREPLEKTVARLAKRRAKNEIGYVEIHMALEGQATPVDEARIEDYIMRHIREKDLWED
jgi:hypothetical protein